MASVLHERLSRAGARAAYALAAAGLAVWTWRCGKDLGWDVMNHHVYLPFSLTSGRFATDLLAAGPQSTQHPLGYLPFWGMLSMHWPSWAIGAAFVLVHAAVAVPLWRIAVALWPDPLEGLWWRWLALAMSLLAPTLLLVVGTSSTDPLTALLVLWALALVLTGRRRRRSALMAGLLLGLAAVIKPSNVVFALACVAAWVSRPAPWRGTATLLLTATATVLLLQAPWSMWLWQAFRSPLFPLFNSLFQSPYAPLDSLLSSQFQPAQLADWLWRPFALAQPDPLTHTEVSAPDLRPALAVLALAAAALAAGLHRRRMPAGAAVTVVPTPTRELLIFTAVSYAAWMATSGNSRYALPLFIALGLVLTWAVHRALPAAPARALLVLVVLVQAGSHVKLAPPRVDTAVRWGSRPYVDVEVPQRLRDQPALHLRLGTPSFAAVAPALHRDGAFVGAISTMSLPTEGPLGDALRERLARWQGRTRVLFRGAPPLAGDARAAAARASHDRGIYRFGLQVDWRDCEELRVVIRESPGDPSAVTRLSSCAARPREAEDPGYAAALARAERAFGIVEAQCPQVFGPPPLATNAEVGSWHRHYLRTDARLAVADSEGVFASHFSVRRAERLGSVDEVLAGRGAPPCVAWKALVRR